MDTKKTRTRKNAELLNAFLDRIMSGETISSICRDETMPDRTTIHRWLRDDEKFYTAYAKAVAVRAHEMILEAVEIADRPKQSSAEVAADKLRYDARMRAAGKLNPRYYGEKQTKVTTEGSKTARLKKIVVEVRENTMYGNEGDGIAPDSE